MLQRLRALTIFCERLVANPYLRYDASWIDFLTPGVSFLDGSAAQTPHAGGAPDGAGAGPNQARPITRQGGANLGEARWAQALAEMFAPSDALATLARLLDELKLLETALEGAYRATQQLCHGLEKTFDGLSELAACLGRAGDVERSTLELLNARTGPAAQQGASEEKGGIRNQTEESGSDRRNQHQMSRES